MVDAASSPVIRHTVASAVDLDAVVSKAANACFLIPELADEDSPEGWQVMGASRKRIRATVRQFLEHALYDLTHGIPEEYRHLPQVEEQRDQLRALLEGRDGRWPFTVELHEQAALDPDYSGIAAERFAQCDDGRPSEVLPASSGGKCRPIDEQLGLQEAIEEDAAPKIVELGDPESLRRCVIVPRLGAQSAQGGAWYSWLRGELEKTSIFEEVACADAAAVGDAVALLRDQLAVGPGTVVVAHSTAACATLRLAEATPVGGLVLVAAMVGDSAEGHGDRSGQEAFKWDVIRMNIGWVLQLHSCDDPEAPIAGARGLSEALGSDFLELEDLGHVSEPCPALLQALVAKLQ
mmetsp:Transcript_109142/g.314387  ORF Transcript_109142/g.314387 Transcript_109142/m.314387 type:complete len:350 (-) Transcript_109142:195-1244(-)